MNTRDTKNFTTVLRSIERRELFPLINPLSVNNFVEIIQDGYALNISPRNTQLQLCLGQSLVADTNNSQFICADPSELPLQLESIDVALLTHVLEFVDHPQLILEEIYPTLAPQGLLYIVGFNSMSLLGLARYFHAHDQWPYTGKFLTIPSVLKQARRVGYAVLHFKTFGFYYSKRDAKLNEKLLFLEPLGQFLISGLGGIYCIVLQKNVLGTVNPSARAKKRKTVNTVDSYI